MSRDAMVENVWLTDALRKIVNKGSLGSERFSCILELFLCPFDPLSLSRERRLSPLFSKLSLSLGRASGTFGLSSEEKRFFFYLILNISTHQVGTFLWFWCPPCINSNTIFKGFLGHLDWKFTQYFSGGNIRTEIAQPANPWFTKFLLWIVSFWRK